MPEVHIIVEMLAEGMSYSEIGASLGITKNKAIGIVARAKINSELLLVGILDLKPRQCRFIVGHHKKNGAIFCAETVSRSSYCSEHYSVCYRPVLDIELPPDGY